MKINFDKFKKKLQMHLLHYAAATVRHYESKNKGILGSQKTRIAHDQIKESYIKMEDDLYAAVMGEVKDERDRIIKVINEFFKEGDRLHFDIVKELIDQIREKPTDGLQAPTGTGQTQTGSTDQV